MMINDCYRSTSFIKNPGERGSTAALSDQAAPGTPIGAPATNGTEAGTVENKIIRNKIFLKLKYL